MDIEQGSRFDDPFGTHEYLLKIDGPMFRRQRLWLIELADAEENPEPRSLMEGLINLLDDIADQAHDSHGIDCLLTEDEEE
jgi:hypothetical protein